jgi:signal transduction histidine kinase
MDKAAAFNRAVFETGYQQFEWMHQTTSGEALPAEVTLVRLPWQGGWCTAAYIRDLREAKTHERKMREAAEYAKSLEVASQAARLASQAKSEFLAKMSHELRTPLNAAIGFLGLELQKDLPQENADNLEMSLDACYTLLHLINDILDISKIEAGHFELTNNEYRLAGLINETVSLNSFRLLHNSFDTASTPLTFRLEVDENLPSQLYGDDLRIKQVLNNLLSNAFKYTEKGTITLAVALATGEEEQAGSLPIRFSVRDTGKGIKPENFEVLFTAYTRFDSKANRFIEGAGLGLAISKHLVEMMDGRMHVESEY